MKLNWGHYILISFIVFVLLILYMVFRSYQSDNDLVAEDYYSQELDYQSVIEKSKRAGNLTENIHWVSEEQGIKVIYPSEMTGISGKINLFRPSDKDLDFEVAIKQDTSNIQLIPIADLHRGKYILQIDWNYLDEDYFTEGVVFISK